MTLARLDCPRLSAWIASHATEADDWNALLTGFCETLLAGGVPLWRLSVSTPAIDPTARGFSMNWIDGEGPSLVSTPHGAETEAAFRRSPIYALMEEERPFARWRLDGRSELYPMLDELRARGATDYALFMTRFAPGSALRGVAVSFASKDEAGFTDDTLADLQTLLPALTLAASKLSLSQTLRETLAIYLGPATAMRVLEGEIVRGEGRTIPAAILLTDLRGFTALTDRVDPLRVVGWLDEHFEALGDPVAENGGEILKFLGDGFLAVFPIEYPDASPCLVSHRVVDAARKGLRANRALNDRRRAAGLPALDADVVLHYGEVVYGNVGTRRRLDFTVIGRAVNEASRMEKLCGDLGVSLLVSDAFAARCSPQFEQVATLTLRGVEHLRRLWTLPEEAKPTAASTP